MHLVFAIHAHASWQADFARLASDRKDPEPPENALLSAYCERSPNNTPIVFSQFPRVKVKPGKSICIGHLGWLLVPGYVGDLVADAACGGLLGSQLREPKPWRATSVS